MYDNNDGAAVERTESSENINFFMGSGKLSPVNLMYFPEIPCRMYITSLNKRYSGKCGRPEMLNDYPQRPNRRKSGSLCFLRYSRSFAAAVLLFLDDTASVSLGGTGDADLVGCDVCGSAKVGKM